MARSPRWRARWALAGFLLTVLVTRTVTTVLHLRGAGTDGGLLVAGVHLHHMVFGLAILVGLTIAWLFGAAWATVRAQAPLTPIMFGVAWALVLDEAALILNLADVYWAPLGDESLIAIAVFTGALAVAALAAPSDGLHPGDDPPEAARSGISIDERPQDGR